MGPMFAVAQGETKTPGIKRSVATVQPLALPTTETKEESKAEASQVGTGTRDPEDSAHVGSSFDVSPTAWLRCPLHLGPRTGSSRCPEYKAPHSADPGSTTVSPVTDAAKVKAPTNCVQCLWSLASLVHSYVCQTARGNKSPDPSHASWTLDLFLRAARSAEVSVAALGVWGLSLLALDRGVLRLRMLDAGAMGVLIRAPVVTDQGRQRQLCGLYSLFCADMRGDAVYVAEVMNLAIEALGTRRTGTAASGTLILAVKILEELTRNRDYVICSVAQQTLAGSGALPRLAELVDKADAPVDLNAARILGNLCQLRSEYARCLTAARVLRGLLRALRPSRPLATRQQVLRILSDLVRPQPRPVTLSSFVHRHDVYGDDDDDNDDDDANEASDDSADTAGAADAADAAARDDVEHGAPGEDSIDAATRDGDDKDDAATWKEHILVELMDQGAVERLVWIALFDPAVSMNVDAARCLGTMVFRALCSEAAQLARRGVAHALLAVLHYQGLGVQKEQEADAQKLSHDPEKEKEDSLLFTLSALRHLWFLRAWVPVHRDLEDPSLPRPYEVLGTLGGHRNRAVREAARSLVVSLLRTPLFATHVSPVF